MPESKPLMPGSMAPLFALEDEQSRLVGLEDFRGNRVVLYFYVHDGNSGCTSQGLSYRNHFEELRAIDAVVLALSPDSPESHGRFKAEHDLPFTLLTDEGGRIAQRYGCWGEREIMGRKVMGVIRSHFVLDEYGVLIDIQRGVGASDSAVKALAALMRLEL